MKPLALAAVAVLLGVLTAAAQERERLPPALIERGAATREKAAAQGSDAALADQQPAQWTRQQLHERILRQYPPTLPQVLRLDPTLLTNDGYLKMYPALAAFLALHPEVAHNPGFFLGGYASGWDPGMFSDRSRAIGVVESVLEGGLFLTGFCFFAGLTAWGARSFLDHRRWLRASKLQTDVHSKLLDRLTSNEDLLAYIQSPAGRQFLEGAPIQAGPRQTLSAPINRILWSVQVGVILMLAGSGLWYSRTLTIAEVGQPLSVFGVLSMFLGTGFALSALVSYGLSKALGLFDPPALRPNA